MFEKEFEEYKNLPKWKGKIFMKDEEICFKDGAEFGYNKANEWHYVKDGDYPKEYEDILICFIDETEESGSDCVRGWYEYDLDNDKHIFKTVNIQGTLYLNDYVYAWKEIVLPKLPKESE